MIIFIKVPIQTLIGTWRIQQLSFNKPSDLVLKNGNNKFNKQALLTIVIKYNSNNTWFFTDDEGKKMRNGEMRMKRDMGENYGHNGTKKFTQFFQHCRTD